MLNRKFFLTIISALFICFGCVSPSHAASATGTEVDFTGLSSPTEITVALKDVSTNGASDILVQFGNGSYATTGYSGGGSNFTADAQSTAGVLINVSTATGKLNGLLFLKLVDAGSNLWAVSGTFNDASNNAMAMSGSTVTLTGSPDRLRATTVNGTDQFDAGTIDIVAQ